MSIEGRLRRLMAYYDNRGNKELALFFADGEWSLHVGNQNNHVMLGEVSGDYVYDAHYIEECIGMAEKDLADVEGVVDV